VFCAVVIIASAFITASEVGIVEMLQRWGFGFWPVVACCLVAFVGILYAASRVD
jgi:hypothetical protein